MDIMNISPEETKEEPEKTEKEESILSKKQIKKLKRAEKWEEMKKLKKQKKKEMKLLAKTLPKPETPIIENVPPVKKRINKTEKQQYKLEVQNSHPIIIDCSFQPLMMEKEIKSLCLQLAYCHSINRKFAIRSQIVITSFKDQIKQKLTKTNAQSWGIVLEEKHYLDLYDKNKLVYLTGDAEEEMGELENDKIYIIGGMVDHNRLKLATYNKAKEEGLVMKKFPIQAFLKLKTSTILTVNHVFEIMIRKMNGETWENALKNSIPKRKVVEEEEEGDEKLKNNEEEEKKE